MLNPRLFGNHNYLRIGEVTDDTRDKLYLFRHL